MVKRPSLRTASRPVLIAICLTLWHRPLLSILVKYLSLRGEKALSYLTRLRERAYYRLNRAREGVHR